MKFQLETQAQCFAGNPTLRAGFGLSKAKIRGKGEMRPVGVRSFCSHENCPARMFLSYPKRVFLYTPLSLSTPAKEVTAKNLCSCRAGRNGNSTSAGKPQREGCLYMLKCSNAAILQLANSCFIKNQNCFPKALERQENPKQCCKCLIFII